MTSVEEMLVNIRYMNAKNVVSSHNNVKRNLTSWNFVSIVLHDRYKNNKTKLFVHT